MKKFQEMTGVKLQVKSLKIVVGLYNKTIPKTVIINNKITKNITLLLVK